MTEPTKETKTARVIDALTKIRDFDVNAMLSTGHAVQAMKELATNALKRANSSAATVEEMTSEVKNFLTRSPKLMFAAAGQIADALNADLAANDWPSVRATPWTKSSVTMVLTDARQAIAEDLEQKKFGTGVGTAAVSDRVAAIREDITERLAETTPPLRAPGEEHIRIVGEGRMPKIDDGVTMEDPNDDNDDLVAPGDLPSIDEDFDMGTIDDPDDLSVLNDLDGLDDLPDVSKAA